MTKSHPKSRLVGLPKIVISTFLALLFISDSTLIALDGPQSQALSTAEATMKQAEVNLKLAQDAAGQGTAAIQGSRAKLVQSRLGMVREPVKRVKELMAKLPADNSKVAALQKRVDTASTALETLDTRLSGKPVPNDQPNGEGKSKPTPSGKNSTTDSKSKEMKLDYKQEQLAKEIRFYLDEMEGYSGGLADVVTKVEEAEDPLSIDHRLIQSAVNTMTKARQRAGFVQERLDQLPKNGRGIADLAAVYKSRTESIDASDKVIAPLHKELMALVDPAAYPNFEKDVKRLQELGSMYSEPMDLSSKYERAALLVNQIDAAKSEADRCVQTYGRLIQQKTPMGDQIENVQQFFLENVTTFSAAATKAKDALPDEIDGELTKLSKLVEEAVTEQKPAFFQGGIPQAVSGIDERLILLTALDTDQARLMTSKLEQAKREIASKETSLRQVIIQSNQLPPDRYSGNDKRKLEKLAIEIWKQSEPKADVL
ncbi:MAG: hypothetical protein FJ267_09840, partial [Planctomycetes bacterium]|nr:hypothetical protein [Planctomycetota bacterium]